MTWHISDQRCRLEVLSFGQTKFPPSSMTFGNLHRDQPSNSLFLLSFPLPPSLLSPPSFSLPLPPSLPQLPLTTETRGAYTWSVTSVSMTSLACSTVRTSSSLSQKSSPSCSSSSMHLITSMAAESCTEI